MPKLTLERLLRDDFPARFRERGQRYLDAGRVAIDAVTPHGVHGRVRGAMTYDVELVWEPEPGESSGLCTCPAIERFGVCKHLWALVLAVDAGDLAPTEWLETELGYLEPARGDDDAEAPELRADREAEQLERERAAERHDDAEEELERLNAASSGPGEDLPGADARSRPAERPGAARAAGPARAIEPWRKRVQRLALAGRRREPWAEAETRDRTVTFLLDLDASVAESAPVVQTFQMRRRKDGRWGAPRAYAPDRREIEAVADPEERRLLALLESLAAAKAWSGYGLEARSRHALDGELAFELLPRMARGRRLAWASRHGNGLLAWDEGPPWRLALDVEQQDEEAVVRGWLERDGARMELAAPLVLFPSGLLVTHDAIARFDARGAMPWIVELRRDGPIRAPRDQVSALAAAVLQHAPAAVGALGGIEVRDAPLEPRLLVGAPKRRRPDRRLECRVVFRYAGVPIEPEDPRPIVIVPPADPGAAPAGAATYVRRDLAREREELARLVQLGVRRARRDSYAAHDATIAPSRVAGLVRGLLAAGWNVEAEGRLYRNAGATSVSVRSGIDWFELEGAVAFGDQKASFPELLAAARERRDTVVLGDGSFGVLPERWLERWGLLALAGKAQGDALRVPRAQGFLLDALLAAREDARADVDPGFAGYRERLARFSGVRPARAPASFRGTLREYQEIGLGWLGYLREMGLGGCLADDMGLGKTIQVLAHLESLRAARAQAALAGPDDDGGVAREAREGGTRTRTSAARAARRADGGARAAGRDDRATSSANTPEERATSSAGPRGDRAASRAGIREDRGASRAGTRDGRAASRAATDTSEDGARRPSLVVAPRSLVFNWLDEARRFTPELSILDYTGPDRAARLARAGDVDVLVTTYGTLRRDAVPLSERRFDTVVLDEAQAIKNPASLAAKAARLLQADHRLALSGTPVENHLGELWSLFEFLNPGMLGRAQAFQRWVGASGRVRPAEAKAEDEAPGDMPDGEAREDDALGDDGLEDDALESDALEADADDPDGDAAPGEGSALDDPADSGSPAPGSGLEELAHALRPFFLRRTKAEVLHDLPAKSEQVIVCRLGASERRRYEELREHYRSALLARTDQELERGQMHVLEALLRLRQCACHPGLLDPARRGERSAKLDALLLQLDELVDEGHKALVFSQFTTLLGIVRGRLDATGVGYAYLDGSTRDRKGEVERFQSDPACPVFLVSLKAGGQGLNLTAADYVFLLDPWWNPAVESQAIDRAHRIGRARPVHAYRLIAAGTVEERIQELQADKRSLAEAIFAGRESATGGVTREDLERLLA